MMKKQSVDCDVVQLTNAQFHIEPCPYYNIENLELYNWNIYIYIYDLEQSLYTFGIRRPSFHNSKDIQNAIPCCLFILTTGTISLMAAAWIQMVFPNQSCEVKAVC